MYYSVDSVLDRRVRPEDGALEYKVKWEGYEGAQETTWEPRQGVTECCAEEVQAVDQTCMEETDVAIAAWREANGFTAAPVVAEVANARKRARSSTAEDDGNVEVLSSVLLRTHSSKTSSSSTTAEGTASVVILGEVILTEEAATVLANPTRRGRRGATQRKGGNSCLMSENTSQLCAPAVSLEKAWRDRFGVSLMHSCVGSSTHHSVKEYYAYEAKAELKAVEHRLSEGRLRILGLAPVEVSSSGQVFREPVTFVPWIGPEEAERLRRHSTAEAPSFGAAAQEVLRPQQEHMVVRYALLGEKNGDVHEKQGPGKEMRGEGSGPVVASMPLTVFRTVFPQLLLDYLLEHSIALEG